VRVKSGILRGPGKKGEKCITGKRRENNQVPKSTRIEFGNYRGGDNSQLNSLNSSGIGETAKRGGSPNRRVRRRKSLFFFKWVGTELICLVFENNEIKKCKKKKRKRRVKAYEGWWSGLQKKRNATPVATLPGAGQHG